jgi:cell division protease FtsH
VGGLEKKTKVMTQDEKRGIAIHEAGHATISWFCQYADPLIKVTIVPRGQALGAAWYLPEERVNVTKNQMLDKICSLVGGRAAEEIFLGHISTGALNDLERANKMAFSMIAYYGMSDNLYNVSYYNTGNEYFQKPYSDLTAQKIDEEVKALIAEQYERAKKILAEHGEGHAKVTQMLMDREVIFAEDVENVFGKRPWVSRSDEIIAENERMDKEREEAEKREADEKERRQKAEIDKILDEAGVTASSEEAAGSTATADNSSSTADNITVPADNNAAADNGATPAGNGSAADSDQAESGNGEDTKRPE